MPRVIRVRRDSADSLFAPPWPVRCWRFFTGGETWTAHHVSVFLITFFSFAFIHGARKTLSTVKPSLIAAWTHNASHEESPLFPNSEAAQEFLAFLDAGFMIAYAIGLFFGGILGDRYNPRIVLAIGMLLSSIVIFLFGFVTEEYRIYNKTLYAFLWIIGGLFQSVAWPTEVCVMGNWFGHSSRGIVMGLWSGCASVGNIIGTLVTSRAIRFGYEWAFAVNSGFLFGFAFVVYFYLVSAPRDVGLPEPMESPDERNRVIEEVTERPKPINFWRAWLLPGVIPYSLAYACLKMVNYGFFFWLPFYLHSNFGWPEDQADALSTWYDVGGIVAAVVAGAASDHFSSRTSIIMVLLVSSTFALWGYSKSPPDILINGILLTIAGFCVGGPGNMISGAVSADLGKAREVRGNAEALSTVTGIVDGTGSVGAAFGQLLIPAIKMWFGWSAVFYGFIFMIVLTTLILFPLFYRELMSSRRLVSVLSHTPSEEEEGLLEGEGEGHAHAN